MGIIEGQYLNEKNFKEYIEKIEGEDIEREPKILETIKEILVKNLDNLKRDTNEAEKQNSNIINIEHIEGKNFEGIINYLEMKFGKDIHNQGIIAITTSSTYAYSPPPNCVIDYSLSGCQWYSDNNTGNWLEINFKKYKVKINGYSLKTCHGGANGCYHLKNWVIEGSKDRSKWEEIDKQVNNNDLNGSHFQKYYSISKTIDEFQFIRIRSIGVNHNGSHFLHITNLEFYGAIIF